MKTHEFREFTRNCYLPVLVQFYDLWSAPCRETSRLLQELSEEYRGKLIFIKINVFENPGLAKTLGLRNIPTLMTIRQRTQLNRWIGPIKMQTLSEFIEDGIYEAATTHFPSD